MRKEILITNYYPAKLKEARELSGMSLDDVEAIGSIDIDILKLYEIDNPITPIDIFLLGYLLNLYEEQAIENGKDKIELSLTSDLMFPHPAGIAYQEAIVASPNFEGMPYERNAQGHISWMTTIKTKQGQERMQFWITKMKQYNIDAKGIMDAGVRQKVAFINHPTKQHVCLYTGNALYIDYRYPAPSRIDIINKEYDESFKYYDQDILQLVTLLYEVDSCEIFCRIFNINIEIKNLDELLTYLKKEFIQKEKRRYVSPGVMSNSPDRLDGYHSYNSDVRDVCDTGRRKKNLKRYTQDRRVYEKWSDGDWKMADRLYAEFVKHGVSPDHIGPMSLGFAHRPKFHPMTSQQNSSKGNRMTLNDVMVLLADEKRGEQVVSWHSKFIWDKLKDKVKVNEDALTLSALMRKNLHHVLIIFSIIYEKGFGDFLLQFLNPEHSYYDYIFVGFDPLTGEYKSVFKKELNGKNQKNNADRYLKIAFETLVEYMKKENRKGKIWNSDKVDNGTSKILEFLESEKNDQAREQLMKVLALLADLSEANW